MEGFRGQELMKVGRRKARGCGAVRGSGAGEMFRRDSGTEQMGAQAC